MNNVHSKRAASKLIEGINDIVVGWLMWPVRAARTARTRRDMLCVKVLSLIGLRATQACCTATRNGAAIVGEISMSRIWTAIWSQGCSKGFTSGLLDGQSVTSTSWSSEKSLVAWTVCVCVCGGGGGALSWTSTKMFWKVVFAQVKRLFRSTHLLV